MQYRAESAFFLTDEPATAIFKTDPPSRLLQVQRDARAGRTFIKQIDNGFAAKRIADAAMRVIGEDMPTIKKGANFNGGHTFHAEEMPTR